MYQGVNIGELETMVLWYMYTLFFEMSHMRYSSATYCCLPYEIQWLKLYYYYYYYYYYYCAYCLWLYNNDYYEKLNHWIMQF